MRTEQEVLKDFEALGYKLERGYEKYFGFNSLCINKVVHALYDDGEQLDKEIVINLDYKGYFCHNPFYGGWLFFTMQEHKLLNELFTIWRWI